MTTVRQVLQSGSALLAASSPSPRLDAEVLLAHTLGMARAYVLAEGAREVAEQERAVYYALLARRAALEPIAYIVGHKEFYGLDFVVDQRVLVPRPETELLVDLARSWAAQQPVARQAHMHIADIGTGSGCIAVALAVHLPSAHIHAIDLSPDALDVARTNVARHGVADRVTLLHGDGCQPLPGAVDLIVSNPPYTVLDEVDENVRRWEPHLALDGGAERGFATVQRLIEQTPAYLQPHGAVMLEISAWQGGRALETARRVFPHAEAAIHQDLAGLDRVLTIQ